MDNHRPQLHSVKFSQSPAGLQSMHLNNRANDFEVHNMHCICTAPEGSHMMILAQALMPRGATRKRLHPHDGGYNPWNAGPGTMDGMSWSRKVTCTFSTWADGKTVALSGTGR